MAASRAPSVDGLLPTADVRRTAESIAATQERDGALPWPDGHVEAWDHVESAMALRLAGLQREAAAAWEWLGRAQRPDGTWPMATVGGTVTDAGADTNQTAYVATGLWHTWLVTGRRDLVDPFWPVVRRALDAVLDLQAPTGELAWARGAAGEVDPEALLAASASCEQSLRCGVALGELLGDPQAEWELAAAGLAHAVTAQPELFGDRGRFSMDWYYPVLSGTVRGPRAVARLRARWGEFVVPGLGVRCVSDRPWVTGAETCELVLALDAVGEARAARALLGAVQHLRHDDGSYWTGWVWPDAAHFPEERSSWTAAAVVLAAAALDPGCRGGDLFRSGRARAAAACGDTCAAPARPA